MREFYSAYAKSGFAGLPRAADMPRLEPHLSDGLTRLIRNAQARQSACVTARSGVKPPWADGDLFTGNFEGFTRFRLPLEGALAGTARWILEVAFERMDASGTGSLSWHDRVLVVRERGRWVIDDVLYRATGSSFGLRRSLSADPRCP